MGILRPVMVISMISPLKLKRTSRFFEGPLMKLERQERQFMLHGMHGWMRPCSTFYDGRRFRISPRQPSSLISLAHFFLISSIKMNLF